MTSSHVLRATGVIACHLFVAMAIAEGALRLASWIAHTAGAATETSAGLVERRPLPVGWAPRPGHSEERSDPAGNRFTFRIDRHGVRSRTSITTTPEPDHRRILLLGDSFTMATSFPWEQTFAGHVERNLQERSTRPVEVVNGSVPGYGTYNDLGYYRLDLRRLRPHVVMLCFYTGNDFRDNAVTTRFGSRVDPFLLPDAFAYRDPAALPPRVQRRDQGWLRDPVTGAVVPQPRNHLVTELARKSFLARRLVSRLLRLHGRWSRDLAIIDLDDQHYYYEIGFFQHRSEPTFQQSIRLALHCLDELHRAVLGDGAELVLVVLPSDLQLVDAELSKTFAELELGEPDFGELDRRRVNRILEAHAAERGIPHLDLWDEFASNPAPERLYLSHEGDRHLSGEGHRVAGAAIAQFLRRHAQSLTDPAVDAYREGVAQAEAGLDSLALGSLSRAVDSSSGWAAPHLALGDLLFRRGRSAAARDAYEMALRAAPESDHILKALGDAHWALADSARALASYRRAAELRPNDLIHREKLVVFAHRNGRADEVAVERAKITEFLQRLDEPAWDGVRQGFADRLYGEGTATIDSELAGHYLRRAAAEYERLLARVPDATLRSNLGSTYLHLGRIDEARSLFESAALDGASAEGHYNLAIVLTRDGDHEQAAAHFRRAAELQPEGETYFRLGNSLGRAGDLRGAVTAHREAQRLSPSVLKYAFSLAAALAILGNAEQEAGDAQASREAWEEARRTLTSLLAAGGRHPQAQALLTRIETVLDR